MELFFIECHSKHCPRNLILELKLLLIWQNLFELGARKFAIVGVPPIGCCPLSRLADINDHCHKEMNEYARDFQTILSALLQKLSSEYGGMKYSLGNAYEMTMNVIDDPPAFSKWFTQKTI